MPEDHRDPSDPPRKFYGLKPKDFDRANPARPPEATPLAPGNPAGAATPAHDPSTPIDVRQLFQQAATPGPVLNRGPQRNDPNDVHAVLRDNLARETAAGLNTVSDRPARKSKRLRDYLVLMIGGNAVMVYLAVAALHSGNAILFVYSMAGIGAFSAGVTWIIWFVMDKY